MTEGGEGETCFRCLTIDSHMILGSCRTDSLTIGLRGLFMCETNKEDTDTELFAFVCHLMKPAANICKSELFKPQRRTVRSWATTKNLFILTDLTLTIRMAEKCTRTLTVTHIEIFHFQGTLSLHRKISNKTVHLLLIRTSSNVRLKAHLKYHSRCDDAILYSYC